MSAAEQLAAALREAILDGRLAPGERLREEALAQEHGAARHTVRTALRALADEGLVAVAPNRGARVAGLEEAELVGLYELRSALEVEAAHLALARHAGRLPPAVHDACARLTAACEARRPRWARMSEAHGDLHTAIVHAARSPRIAQAHDRLTLETRLFLQHIRPHLTPHGLAEDHRRLVHDLEHDGPDVLRAHLRASASLLVDGLRA